MTGETCTSGSMGTGCNDGTTCTVSGGGSDMHTEVGMFNIKPSCSCDNTEDLDLPNYYTLDRFLERKHPNCENSKHRNSLISGQSDTSSYHTKSYTHLLIIIN